MPGLDRTGPIGKGSKTGREMGKCNPGKELSDEFLGRRGSGRFRNRWLRRGNSAGSGD